MRIFISKLHKSNIRSKKFKFCDESSYLALFQLEKIILHDKAKLAKLDWVHHKMFIDKIVF